MDSKPISFLSNIENNIDLVVVEKFNGFSEYINIDSNGKLHLFSRTGNEHTRALSGEIVIPELAGTVLLAEGIAPSKRIEDAKSIFGSGSDYSNNWQNTYGRAIFVVHDLHRLTGHSYLNLSFHTRRQDILEIVEILNSYGLNARTETLVTKDKEQFFYHIVESGGEGVVVKKLSGSAEDWFKIKNLSTWDTVVIGFTEANYGKTGKFAGLIGAIRYGFWNGETVVEAGKCSGMTDAQRVWFTEHQPDTVGKVIEVKGQELGKGGGIVFPRFVRVRDDKMPKDCTIEQVKRKGS